MTGAPVPVRVLCARTIANVSPGACTRTFARSRCSNSIALLATDCDDVTYLALDEATKAANVSGRLWPQPLCRGRERAHAPDGRGRRHSCGADARRRPQRPCRRAGLPAGRAALPRRRKTESSILPTAPRARGRYLSRAGPYPRGAAVGLSHRAARPGPAGAGRRPEGRRRRACGILRSAHRNELCRSPAHRHQLGLPCRLRPPLPRRSARRRPGRWKQKEQGGTTMEFDRDLRARQEVAPAGAAGAAGL